MICVDYGWHFCCGRVHEALVFPFLGLLDDAFLVHLVKRLLWDLRGELGCQHLVLRIAQLRILPFGVSAGGHKLQDYVLLGPGLPLLTVLVYGRLNHLDKEADLA